MNERGDDENGPPEFALSRVDAAGDQEETIVGSWDTNKTYSTKWLLTSNASTVVTEIIANSRKLALSYKR